MKKSAILLTIVLLVLLQAASAAQWSIGYWSPWANGGAPALPISDIDWGALTHVVHYAALVNTDGTLDLNNEALASNAPTMISTAHANGVKVLLNITQAYWNGQTTNLQSASTGNLNGFVSNIMNVVNTYGYDGVDVDWEPFSSSTNGPAMKQLAAALKAQLGTKPLTVATIVNDYAYWATVAASLDRINVMTYDLTGTWNPYSWFNAALYDQDGQVWSINMAVQKYTSAGVPASKLGIGIPFYGWQWSGGGVTGPRQTWSSSPSLSQTYYAALQPKISQMTYQWDSQAMVPHLSGSNTWVTYDNEQSITAKVNYAKDNNLGGWIIWELNGDYFPSQNPKHPLAEAIRLAMGGSSGTAPSITTTSPMPAGTVGTAYSQTLAASGTTPITWTVTGGALPGGLALSSGGVISGTPNASGTFTFTVQATNSAGNASSQFSLTVAAPPVITTSSPLPAETVGTNYSVPLAATGTAPITWTITGGALPAGQTLSSAGVIGGTPSASGTFTFTVQATNSAGNNSKQLSLTVSSPVTPPAITSTSPLAGGTVGTAYSQTLTASGTAPITWSVTGGALPGGLTLSSSGVIGGTPNALGTFTFTVQAANSAGNNSKQFSATIAGGAPPSGPYAYWKLDDGAGSVAADSSGNGMSASLSNPSWQTGANCETGGCLSFNGTNQYGTAALNLSDTSVVTVAFWMNWAAYANDDKLAMEFSSNFNNVTTGFMVDPNSSFGGGGQFEVGVHGDGGYNQVTFARPTAGAWHHFAFVFNKGAAAASEVIPYVDGVAVPYTKVTTAENTNNFGADTLYLMSRSGSSLLGAGTLDEVQLYKRALSASEIQALATPAAPPATPPTITSTSPLAGGTVGTAYSQTLTASGTTPMTWTVTGGTPPTGLALSSGGVLGGTPSAAGTFTFTVQATNSGGNNSKQFSLTVSSAVVAPAITTTSPLAGGTVGTAYSQTLTATGTAPITWSVTGGALPGGLTLSSSGVIGGTPNALGTFTFTVQAANSAGNNSKQFSATIAGGAPPSGPYAYWKLDDGAGSVAADSSGNGMSASLSNPSWQTGANCETGGCLSFNGTNQYGTAALNLSDTSVVTVAFWMNWAAYANDDKLAMEFSSNFNNVTTGFMIDPNSSFGGGGQFEVGVHGDGGYSEVTLARPTAGAWHHFAFVFNKGAAAGSEVIPYVDGVAVPYTKVMTAENTNNFGADTLYLMSRSGSSLLGAGKLDDVQLYKRALSASEIQALATPAAPPATPPTITSTSPLPAAIIGTTYSQTLAASGTTPMTWTVTAGAAPAGLTVSSAGVISGTPRTAGVYTFTVQASNSAGNASAQFSLTANSGLAPPSGTPPVITTGSTLTGGKHGNAYSQTLAATGTTPMTWSVTGGTLPPGLSLDSSGVLSGTPSTSATYNFTVTATNSAGSNSKAFSLRIK